MKKVLLAAAVFVVCGTANAATIHLAGSAGTPMNEYPSSNRACYVSYGEATTLINFGYSYCDMNYSIPIESTRTLANVRVRYATPSLHSMIGVNVKRWDPKTNTVTVVSTGGDAMPAAVADEVMTFPIGQQVGGVMWVEVQVQGDTSIRAVSYDYN